MINVKRSFKYYQARTGFIKSAAKIPVNSSDALEQNNELVYNLLTKPKQVAIEAQVIPGMVIVNRFTGVLKVN